MLNEKLKGFTLSELMVTLALTAILLSFSYMGFNYLQKLLFQYSEQNNFITEINELKKRFEILSSSPGKILQVSESRFEIESDSAFHEMNFNPHFILFSHANSIDTFHFEAKNIKVDLEKINSPGINRSLVKNVAFEILYKQQLFHLCLSKNYDAFSKLTFELQEKN
jgi:prepilin-type N-terminal cleavage/methylation domain-containing protein